MDGFWRPDFAGAPHSEQCHCLSLKSGRSASAPALARRPFFATDGPQTTLRCTKRSVAVTSPVAGRDRAGRPSVRVERVKAHLPPGAPLLPNEAGAEEGGRRPKKRSAKKAEKTSNDSSVAAKKLSPKHAVPLPAGEGRFVTPFLSRETAVSLKRRFAPRKTLNGSLLQVYICDVSDVTSIPHLR